MTKLTILTLVVLTLLPGCVLHSPQTTSTNRVQYQPSSDDPVEQSLYSHYQGWIGVRHKDRGLDKSGIDCSGFVHITFKKLFNQSLPRSTELLIKNGNRIEEKTRRPGDLVFFKTGIKRRHVGIYVGENKFVHVSKKRGVMVSDLNNPYWQDTYWQTRRVR